MPEYMQMAAAALSGLIAHRACKQQCSMPATKHKVRKETQGRGMQKGEGEGGQRQRVDDHATVQRLQCHTLTPTPSRIPIASAMDEESDPTVPTNLPTKPFSSKQNCLQNCIGSFTQKEAGKGVNPAGRWQSGTKGGKWKERSEGNFNSFSRTTLLS